MYIKEDINIDTTTLLDYNVSNEDIEIQCVILRPPQQKKFILLNVYRPPAGNLQSFDDVLTNCLEFISLFENVEIFVMGDMNIDISNPMSQEALLILKIFSTLGYYNTYNPV